MSEAGFKERVELLEYWAPSLLSKLEDLNDLADCILSVWETAEKHTEERIIKLLEEHVGFGDAEWDSSVLACINIIKGEQK